MTNNKPRKAALIAALVILPAASAQAQYYSSYSPPPPLYPYATSGAQPYAVQVAPNTYVIHRPAGAHPHAAAKHAQKSAPASDRPRKPVDPALVEELRKRGQVKEEVVNTTKVVREKPTVRVTKRVVDDPPRVVEQRRMVEENIEPTNPPRVIERPQDGKPARTAEPREAPKGDDNKKRVIRAEAEVTILGPDRMSIRLFRKGRGADSNAQAD